jgi:hypothetical protein
LVSAVNDGSFLMPALPEQSVNAPVIQSSAHGAGNYRQSAASYSNHYEIEFLHSTASASSTGLNIRRSVLYKYSNAETLMESNWL